MERHIDSSLLSSEQQQEEEEQLYQQLLLQAAREMGSKTPVHEHLPSRLITPQPGLCIKTVSSQGTKVFVNICQSPQIPPPPPLTEAGLVKLLQSDDPSSYRVPMSLGEPHAEIDNSGQGCTAYDVVINDEFFKKTQKDTLFLQFLIAVLFEGLENKYSLDLSREWRVLKNRKCLGSIGQQSVRTSSRPCIQEIDDTETETSQSKGVCPEFRLIVEPPVGDPEYLIAEIELPEVSSSRSLLLDLGEDRLLLCARPSRFHLDCFFPLLIDPASSAAQYHTLTQVLTVTMPIVSSSM
ncbi:PIH1 domain-containing protein 1 [Amia ocellicauda]|uniref:PIH1 domain-containing protein 1 n=1 Tax=Amia ocellicauda TaxID=2972642 RepID=UPI003463B3B7